MFHFLWYVVCLVAVGLILHFANITGWWALPIIVVFAVVLAFGFWPKLYHGDHLE